MDGFVHVFGVVRISGHPDDGFDDGADFLVLWRVAIVVVVSEVFLCSGFCYCDLVFGGCNLGVHA